MERNNGLIKYKPLMLCVIYTIKQGILLLLPEEFY
jgi:hypothetical protein